MSTHAADNLRPVTSLWWLFVLFGVVTLGVGVFFVVSPHETLSTFTVIAGIFLLVDGVLAIFGSIFGKGDGRGLLALIGVLSAIAGLVLIKKPFDTLVVFTLIVGVWFVVAGDRALRGRAGIARGARREHRHRDPRHHRGHRDPGLAGSRPVDARRDHRHRPDPARTLFIVSGWQLHKLNDDLAVSPTAQALP